MSVEIRLSGCEYRKYPHALVRTDPKTYEPVGPIHLATESGEGGQHGRTACGRIVGGDWLHCPPRIFDADFKVPKIRGEISGQPLCQVCAKADNPETDRPGGFLKSLAMLATASASTRNEKP